MNNERIRQLAEEAGYLPDMFGIGHWDSPECKNFAELIVRECAGVLREESERLYKLSAEEKDELFASNFEICAEKTVDNEVMILEHFGVEE